MKASLQGLVALVPFASYISSVAAGPGPGFFRMLCDNLTRERLDPLMTPGKVASHVHTVCGGSSFNAKPSTTKELQKSLCTTCVAAQDKSAYWTPDLYFAHTNGSFLPVEGHGITIYYLFRGEANEKIHAFPEDFAMIAGDAGVRANDGLLFQKRSSIDFNCLGDKPITTDTMPKDATTKCYNGLRAQAFFPNCWNGKTGASPYSGSHVTYPSGSDGNGKCPSTHPKRIVTLFLERLFAVDKFKGMPGRLVFANGDPTGYSFHADFMNGWDPKVLQKATDTCSGLGNISGNMEDCKMLTLRKEGVSNSCARSPTVNEPVTGVFAKLPGSNPISPGPKRAASLTETRPPKMFPSPVAYIGSPPPGTKMLDGKDINTGDANYKYSYCLTDDYYKRSMRNSLSVNGDMTVPKCLAACKAKNYTYCGLEYAAECYGDTAIQNGAKQGGKCDMPCQGDSKTYCGGASAMSLYTLKSAAKSKRSIHSQLNH